MSLRLLKKYDRSFQISIGEEGLVVVYAQNGRMINKYFVRSPDPADSEIIAQLFNSDPQAPFYVYIDTLDQSYIQRTLPAVSAFSINKIAAARLEKEVPKDYLKACIQISRLTSGRKDWIYTFMSVHLDKTLTKWIDFLLPFNNIIIGIYLLPVEIPSILTTLKQEVTKELKPSTRIAKIKAAFHAQVSKFNSTKAGSWDVVLTQNKSGGFRQAAYQNGNIIFSRLLTSINDPDSDVLAGNIEQELSNSTEYLTRLALGFEEDINVHIILAEEILRFIRPEKIKASKVLFYTPYQVAMKLKLQDAVQEKDKFFDPVLLTAFSKYTKRSITLHTPQTQPASVGYSIVRGTEVVTTYAIPIFITLILYQCATLLDWKTSIQTAQSAIESLTSQLDSKNKAISDASGNIKEKVPLDQVTEIVTLHKFLYNYSQDPVDFVLKLSSVLPSYARVKEIRWVYRDEFLDSIKNKTGATIDVTDVKSLNLKFQLDIMIQVVFSNYGSTYTSLVSKYQEFSDILKRQFNRYKVDISELPQTFSIQELNQDISINVFFRLGENLHPEIKLDPTSQESKILEEYGVGK